MSVGQLPAVACLAVVASGLLLARLVDWQPGVVVVAAGLLLAAALRLVLPVRQAGWLVVRSKPLDVALLLVVGAGLLALAQVVPQ